MALFGLGALFGAFPPFAGAFIVVSVVCLIGSCPFGLFLSRGEAVSGSPKSPRCAACLSGSYNISFAVSTRAEIFSIPDDRLVLALPRAY